MNINPDCVFYKECQLFDPQFKRVYADDKIVDWRVHCCNRVFCENAIRMYQKTLDEQREKGKYKDRHNIMSFDCIDDPLKKQGGYGNGGFI